MGGPLRKMARVAPALAALAWAAIAARQGPSPVTARLFDPLAAWSRTHGGPGVTFMALDIGALGYYTGGRIYDQAGLTWPPGQSLDGYAIVRRYAPDYVFVDATRNGLTFMASPLFRARYRAIARWAKTGATDLDPDPAQAPTEWVPDYLMCERIGRPARP